MQWGKKTEQGRETEASGRNPINRKKSSVSIKLRVGQASKGKQVCLVALTTANAKCFNEQESRQCAQEAATRLDWPEQKKK